MLGLIHRLLTHERKKPVLDLVHWIYLVVRLPCACWCGEFSGWPSDR